MQIVLDEKHLVTEIHQNIFLLTAMPALIRLNLDYTSLDELWFPNYR